MIQSARFKAYSSCKARWYSHHHRAFLQLDALLLLITMPQDFQEYFYNKHIESQGFEIVTMEANGGYFDLMDQEWVVLVPSVEGIAEFR